MCLELSWLDWEEVVFISRILKNIYFDLILFLNDIDSTPFTKLFLGSMTSRLVDKFSSSH